MTEGSSETLAPRRLRRKLPKERGIRWGRFFGVLLMLGALGGGIAYGALKLAPLLEERLEFALGKATTQPPPNGSKSAILSFTPVQYLGAGKHGDRTLQFAIGPALQGKREVAVVTGGDGTFQQIGQTQTLPDMEFSVIDLPKAPQTLVGKRTLPVRALPAPLRLDNTAVVQAHGGEPDYRAWRLNAASGGLTEVNYYERIAPAPPADTAILVDKHLNVLWYYENGALVHTFRVTTGRHLQGPYPSKKNQEKNYLTPAGWYKIANKKAEGMPYFKENIPAGDPRNPLGTRWIGFSVYPGDGGLVWGIHGTDRPEEIGRWASDGCIRLSNKDVETLFSHVKVGIPLVIRDGQ